MSAIGKFIENIRIRRSPFYRAYSVTPPVRVVDSRTCVSRERSFIYFRIPRAANSTITMILYSLDTGVTDSKSVNIAKNDHFNRMSELNEDELKKETFKNFFKFTVVRHPTERFLSFYLGKVERLEDRAVRSKLERIMGKPHGAPITIEETLDCLASGRNLLKNGHWAPQTALITIPPDELDFIGRFENLQADMATICRRIFQAEPPKLSWRSHATNARAVVGQRISRRIEDRLIELYQADYEAFGYQRLTQ